MTVDIGDVKLLDASEEAIAIDKQKQIEEEDWSYRKQRAYEWHLQENNRKGMLSSLTDYLEDKERRKGFFDDKDITSPTHGNTMYFNEQDGMNVHDLTRRLEEIKQDADRFQVDDRVDGILKLQRERVLGAGSSMGKTAIDQFDEVLNHNNNAFTQQLQRYKDLLDLSIQAENNTSKELTDTSAQLEKVELELKQLKEATSSPSGVLTLLLGFPQHEVKAAVKTFGKRGGLRKILGTTNNGGMKEMMKQVEEANKTAAKQDEGLVDFWKLEASRLADKLKVVEADLLQKEKFWKAAVDDSVAMKQQLKLMRGKLAKATQQQVKETASSKNRKKGRRESSHREKSGVGFILDTISPPSTSASSTGLANGNELMSISAADSDVDITQTCEREVQTDYSTSEWWKDEPEVWNGEKSTILTPRKEEEPDELTADEQEQAETLAKKRNRKKSVVHFSTDTCEPEKSPKRNALDAILAHSGTQPEEENTFQDMNSFSFGGNQNIEDANEKENDQAEEDRLAEMEGITGNPMDTFLDHDEEDDIALPELTTQAIVSEGVSGIAQNSVNTISLDHAKTLGVLRFIIRKYAATMKDLALTGQVDDGADITAPFIDVEEVKDSIPGLRGYHNEIEVLQEALEEIRTFLYKIKKTTHKLATEISVLSSAKDTHVTLMQTVKQLKGQAKSLHSTYKNVDKTHTATVTELHDKITFQGNKLDAYVGDITKKFQNAAFDTHIKDLYSCKLKTTDKIQLRGILQDEMRHKKLNAVNNWAILYVKLSFFHNYEKGTAKLTELPPEINRMQLQMRMMHQRWVRKKKELMQDRRRNLERLIQVNEQQQLHQQQQQERSGTGFANAPNGPNSNNTIHDVTSSYRPTAAPSRAEQRAYVKSVQKKKEEADRRLMNGSRTYAAATQEDSSPPTPTAAQTNFSTQLRGTGGTTKVAAPKWNAFKSKTPALPKVK